MEGRSLEIAYREPTNEQESRIPRPRERCATSAADPIMSRWDGRAQPLEACESLDSGCRTVGADSLFTWNQPVSWIARATGLTLSSGLGTQRAATLFVALLFPRRR